MAAGVEAAPAAGEGGATALDPAGTGCPDTGNGVVPPAASRGNGCDGRRSPGGENGTTTEGYGPEPLEGVTLGKQNAGATGAATGTVTF